MGEDASHEAAAGLLLAEDRKHLGVGSMDERGLTIQDLLMMTDVLMKMMTNPV